MTSLFSQNSRQHYREGYLTTSPYSSTTQDALSQFQTVHFTKCFAQWHYHKAHCMKFQGDYVEGMLLC